MSKHLSKKDIYDNQGVLLLGKGQEMTDVVIRKLKMLGNYKPEEWIDLDDKQSAVFAPDVQAFGVRMNIRDNHVLEQPNKILSTIIFESKTRPWWIYVNAMGNYIDWLYTHSINVAIISLMMAVEQGYNDEELGQIGLGAFFHNIGKLLIPKDIVQKPGPLSDVEIACIHQYCELGVSSLKPFNLARECTDIVLQHQERLDGSGYPKGLRGDEICRNAKIVMIADAFDAITSGRPYREPEETGAAIEILRDKEGRYSQELITLLEQILG